MNVEAASGATVEVSNQLAKLLVSTLLCRSLNLFMAPSKFSMMLPATFSIFFCASSCLVAPSATAAIYYNNRLMVCGNILIVVINFTRIFLLDKTHLEDSVAALLTILREHRSVRSPVL